MSDDSYDSDVTEIIDEDSFASGSDDTIVNIDSDQNYGSDNRSINNGNSPSSIRIFSDEDEENSDIGAAVSDYSDSHHSNYSNHSNYSVSHNSNSSDSQRSNFSLSHQNNYSDPRHSNDSDSHHSNYSGSIRSNYSDPHNSNDSDSHHSNYSGSNRSNYSDSRHNNDSDSHHRYNSDSHNSNDSDSHHSNYSDSLNNYTDYENSNYSDSHHSNYSGSHHSNSGNSRMAEYSSDSNNSNNLNHNNEVLDSDSGSSSVFNNDGHNSDNSNTNNDDSNSRSSNATISPQQSSDRRSRNAEVELIEVNTTDGEGSDAETATSTTAQSSPVLKRKLSQKEPQKSPKKARTVEKEDSDEEGELCPICLDVWTSGGKHRIVTLKCGHLFGESCINRWIIGLKNSHCPQCKAKAGKKDIIPIFVKPYKVLDSSERDDALKRLEEETAKRMKIEKELAKNQLEKDIQIMKLKNELKELKESNGKRNSSKNSVLAKSNVSLLNDVEFINVSKTGGCYVIAYNTYLNILVASMPSPSPIFKNFGVKKIRIGDRSSERYSPLHDKQIRGISFSPYQPDLMLSVGLDKMIKITNIQRNNLVQSFKCDNVLWCCCWSPVVNEFYVGTANGVAYRYSIINRESHEEYLTLPGKGPVVSITYVKSSNPDGEKGIIAARLDKLSFVEIKDDNSFGDIKECEIDGLFMHVEYNLDNGLLLVSCRPSSNYKFARHFVYKLEGRLLGFHSFTKLQCFEGSAVFSGIMRTSLSYNQDKNESHVLAYNESKSSLCVWNAISGNKVQEIKLCEKIIDVCAFDYDQRYAAFLTDKDLRIYKFTNT